MALSSGQKMQMRILKKIWTHCAFIDLPANTSILQFQQYEIFCRIKKKKHVYHKHSFHVTLNQHPI